METLRKAEEAKNEIVDKIKSDKLFQKKTSASAFLGANKQNDLNNIAKTSYANLQKTLTFHLNRNRDFKKTNFGSLDQDPNRSLHKTRSLRSTKLSSLNSTLMASMLASDINTKEGLELKKSLQDKNIRKYMDNADKNKGVVTIDIFDVEKKFYDLEKVLKDPVSNKALLKFKRNSTQKDNEIQLKTPILTSPQPINKMTKIAEDSILNSSDSIIAKKTDNSDFLDRNNHSYYIISEKKRSVNLYGNQHKANLMNQSSQILNSSAIGQDERSYFSNDNDLISSCLKSPWGSKKTQQKRKSLKNLRSESPLKNISVADKGSKDDKESSSFKRNQNNSLVSKSSSSPKLHRNSPTIKKKLAVYKYIKANDEIKVNLDQNLILHPNMPINLPKTLSLGQNMLDMDGLF